MLHGHVLLELDVDPLAVLVAPPGVEIANRREVKPGRQILARVQRIRVHSTQHCEVIEISTRANIATEMSRLLPKSPPQ